MDLAKLDLKRASERGTWVHLTYEGNPLYADEAEKQPMRIRLHGLMAKGVLDAFRLIGRIDALYSERKAKASKGELEGLLKTYQQETDEALAKLVIAAVAEWENIVYDGEALPLNSDNVLTICGPGTLFFDQVQGALGDARRLFTSAVEG